MESAPLGVLCWRSKFCHPDAVGRRPPAGRRAPARGPLGPWASRARGSLGTRGPPPPVGTLGLFGPLGPVASPVGPFGPLAAFDLRHAKPVAPFGRCYLAASAGGPHGFAGTWRVKFLEELK